MEMVNELIENSDEANYAETQLPIVQAKDLLSVLEELVKTGLKVKVKATLMVDYDASESGDVKAV